MTKRHASSIVDKSQKKIGRPRTVSGEDRASTVSVRLSAESVAKLKVIAAETGKLRSDVLRDLLVQAIRRWGR